MCSKELMMNRENKREQITSKDKEKNHYASEKNNLERLRMNSLFAVWFLSEKHSIYIELLLQELLLSNRFQKCLFSLSHFLSFQKCSLLLSHSLFFRIIEHRKSSRKSCHSKDLNLSLNQNDRIYFITYYLSRFDDRSLIIQMLDVNRICNQKKWIIWLKKRLHLLIQNSTKVLLIKILTNEWESWRKFFWWKFWRKNSCFASRI